MIESLEDIVVQLFERIESGGFKDPDIRLLADSIRFIAITLEREETLRMEQRERP